MDGINRIKELQNFIQIIDIKTELLKDKGPFIRGTIKTKYQ